MLMDHTYYIKVTMLNEAFIQTLHKH